MNFIVNCATYQLRTRKKQARLLENSRACTKKSAYSREFLQVLSATPSNSAEMAQTSSVFKIGYVRTILEDMDQTKNVSIWCKNMILCTM